MPLTRRGAFRIDPLDVRSGDPFGFFEASGGDAGSVRWAWFKDPVGSAFDRIPAERERIGALLRALLDRA